VTTTHAPKLRESLVWTGVPTIADARWPFAALLTIFAVLGASFLGFNRSPAQMAITVVAGCALDVALHFALRERKLLVPLSAYISSLSIALLLDYAHDHASMFFPIALTIGSKYVFTFAGRHVFNPSLFGVVGTLLFAGDLISASPAYQWDSWRTISIFMVAAALSLFVFKVERFFLVCVFVPMYAAQTLLRAYLSRHHIPADVLFVGTMTSPTFFLFAFFMLTDPRTSPATRRAQIVVAAAVSILDLVFHARQSLFTFFYAAGTVQTARFLLMHAQARRARGVARHLLAPAVLRNVVVVGALVAAAAYVSLGAFRPRAAAVDATFRLEEVPAATSGVALPHDASLLELFDPRIRHVAKWIVSVGASVAVADVDDDGRQDLFFTAPWAARGHRTALFLNRGALRFERAPLPALSPLDDDPAAHGYASGSLFFDADGDGDQDLLVLVSFGRTLLLKNRLREDGALSFVDASSAAGFDDYTIAVAAAVLDFDRDGALDVVLRNAITTTLPGYDVPTPPHAFALPAPAYEGDRRMFFFLHDSWHQADNAGRTVVWKGRGDGTFARVDGEALGLKETHWTLAIGAADLNGDAFTDLYLGNDFGPDDLYLNDGGKGFVRVEGRFFGEVGKDTYKGMNTTIADLSGDGRPDVYVSNAHVPMLAEGSLLFVNQGGQGADLFSDEAADRGLLNERRFGWGAAAVDLDDDGRTDLVQANGYLDDRFDKKTAECPSYWYANHKLMQAGPDLHTYADKWADLRGFCVFPNERRRVYVNRGEAAKPQFVDVAESAGFTRGDNSRGVAAVDLDDDGRMDVVIANQLGEPTIARNVPLHARGWIAIDVDDCPNDGLGVVVQVGTQVQERQPTSGLSAQSDPRLHFGLGEDPPAAVDVVVRGCGAPMRALRLATGRTHAVGRSSP
jgi:enediyne biosynthesis protein E4